MTTLIAHRGWSGIAPENTLAAIKLALEECKIDTIEIDVHLSKDGIPVVIHDYKLERTTNGFGKVKDYTYEELKKLSAGSWFSPNHTEEKIPSLEEVFQLVGTKKPLLVELKQAASYYEGLEEKVIELITKYGLEETVTLISFDHYSLLKSKDINSKIKRALVFAGSPVLLKEQIQYVEAAAISIHSPYLDKQLVDFLQQNNTKIIVWTVNHQQEMKRLEQVGENIAITTDHPEWLW